MWSVALMNTTTRKQEHAKSEAQRQCVHHLLLSGTLKTTNVPNAHQTSRYSTLPLASANHVCWITNGLPYIKHVFRTAPSTNNGTINSRGASERIRHVRKSILLVMIWTPVLRLIAMLRGLFGTLRSVFVSLVRQELAIAIYRTCVKETQGREMWVSVIRISLCGILRILGVNPALRENNGRANEKPAFHLPPTSINKDFTLRHPIHKKTSIIPTTNTTTKPKAISTAIAW